MSDNVVPKKFEKTTDSVSIVVTPDSISLSVEGSIGSSGTFICGEPEVLTDVPAYSYCGVLMDKWEVLLNYDSLDIRCTEHRDTVFSLILTHDEVREVKSILFGN